MKRIFPSLPSLLSWCPFLLWWPLVNRRSLRDDLLAGFTGALIVLPQGVAFATIAGMPPQYGLYAAMIPAIVAALFGSSWHLVSGPTTAISIAVFAALSPLAEPGSAQYIQLVLTLTFMVGVFQLLLGMARLGALVNFISHSVVIGFTAGAALLIAASQIKNFFALPIARGTPFHQIFIQLFEQLGDINPWVLAVSLTTLATGILCKRYLKRIPYMIAAMIVGSLFAQLLNLWQGVAVTGIKTVGALPTQLPPFSLPDFSIDALQASFSPALVITMLALTEAVSIARAIAVRSEQRIDGNQEFIGQGLSNIVGSFFSAYASSGSFNRSGVNYEAGARTPLASIFAAIMLAIVLLAVAPLAAYLPDAAMAGILFLVAWGLIDFHHISHIWQTSKAEAAILGCTLIGTLINLEMGIFLGVLLSLVMFLYQSSKPEIVPVVPAPEDGAYHFVRAKGRTECPQLRIVRINGSVYFGSASYVQSALQQIDEVNPQQKSVLIAAASLTNIDIAGAEILAQEARRRRRIGGGLYFYRLNQHSEAFLRHGGYAHEIGEGAFFPVMTDVTGALYWTLNPDICSSCSKRIFKQCLRGVLPDGFRRLRLLLATDGSEFSYAPEAIAIAMARSFGVTLDIMTCVASEEAADEETGQARLAAVKHKCSAAKVDAKTRLRHGKQAVEEVVAAATDADSSILIIGRRPPRGGVKEKLVGDNAEQIIVRSPCHVLVANSRAQPWKQRILMVSDGTPISDSVAEMTAQIAKTMRLPVSVIIITSTNEENAETDLREKLGLLQVEGIHCSGKIISSDAEQAVLSTVAEENIDLVVIGNAQHKGISRMLAGQFTERIVGGLECAVLVVKRAPEPERLVAAVKKQA